MSYILKPKDRSDLRLRLGMCCYGFLRRLKWIKMRGLFSSAKSEKPLPYLHFAHKTPLFRQLKDVDMWMQHNKANNLRIASERLNNTVVKQGEILSYWKLIGKPTTKKGYLPGMVLRGGEVHACVGGGLCQLSNLIFWMTLHTPLSIIERHRHGYDVFPDSNRTQPFGSGATCFYPHGDLMIKNETPINFQLRLKVGDEFLFGEWRASAPPANIYKIIERNHEMKMQPWGGYSRHNELYRQKFSPDGELLGEQLVVTNSALMVYSPFIDASDNPPDKSGNDQA